MATRIELALITVPAMTAALTPIRQAMTFSDGRVDGVEIVVPDGCAGLVGFQIGHSGQVIIPYDGASFFVSNDEVVKWPLETFPEAQKWFVQAYNLDQFQHTLSFRWLITDVIMTPTLSPLVPIGV